MSTMSGTTRTSSGSQARVLSNLCALKATDNLPKTLSRLANALKPFTSQLVFVSPSLVLESLDELHESEMDASDTLTDATTTLDLPYVCRETWTPDTAGLDSFVRLQGMVIGGLYSCKIGVRTMDSEFLARASEQVKKELRNCLLHSDPGSKMAQCLHWRKYCFGDATEIDFLEVVGQLKSLGLISTNPLGDITYSPVVLSLSANELQVPRLLNIKRKRKRGKNELSMMSYVLMKTDDPRRSTVNQIQQDTILHKAVCFILRWKEYNSLPKKEQGLANALKSSMPFKKVQYCLPSDVVSTLPKDLLQLSKLCTLKLTPKDMFGVEQFLEKKKHTDDLLKFQKQLVSLAHRTNSCVRYVRESVDENDEIFQETMKRVRSWIAEKQCSSSADAVMKVPLGHPRATEGTMNELVTPPESVTDSHASETTLPTRAGLVSEFLHLCITHTHVKPADIVTELETRGIITVGEGGKISYNIPVPPMTVEQVVRDAIEQERPIQQNEIASGSIGDVAMATARKRQRQGRKVNKKVCL